MEISEAEFNRKHGCKKIKGSPRQVEWAEKIRHRIITEVVEIFWRARITDPRHLKQSQSVVAYLKDRRSATWWISRHRKTGMEILREFKQTAPEPLIQFNTPDYWR